MSRRSFGARLILLITLASGVAVVLVCSILIALYSLRLRDSAVQQLVSHAQVTATHSAAAMEFADQDAAKETLGAFKEVPEIASATLYNTRGGVFAAYARADDAAPDFSPSDADHRFHGRWLVYSQPVTREDRKQLGALLIVYDLSPIYSRSVTNAAISLAVGALATLIAMLLASRLQRTLAQPVSELAGVARTVSATGDFSARATKYSDDELGQLTDNFNDMLAQIQARDAGLLQARQELAESNKELRHRNQEMEQFIYTASHDLKSPIVTILGFITSLRDDLAAGNMELVTDASKRVESSARRMVQLIDDLLTISRIGRLRAHNEPIDTTALVRDLTASLAPRLAEVGAIADVQPDMPAIVMDRARMTQVFECLLSNAVRYGCIGPSPRIEVGGLVEEGEVRFFVRDHGPGIDPAYHKKIFELFQRLHTDDRGTGVGLTIVAKIAQVHGGRVWVQSTPGQGATFWFALPAATLVSTHPQAHDPKGTTWNTSQSGSSSSKTTTATP